MIATCKLEIIFMVLVSGAVGADPQDQSLMIQSGHIQTKGKTKQESHATASMPVPQSECLNINGMYSYSFSGWPKYEFSQNEGECIATCKQKRKETTAWEKTCYLKPIGNELEVSITGNEAVGRYSKTSAKIYKLGEQTLIVWEPKYGWTWRQEVAASQILPPPPPSQAELPVSSDKLYAHFNAEDWEGCKGDEMKLPNRGKGTAEGVIRHFSLYKRKVCQYTDPAGARGNEYPITYIADPGYFDNCARMDFGDVFEPNNDKFTLCSLSRSMHKDPITNPIIQGTGGFKHGHEPNLAGIAKYGGYMYDTGKRVVENRVEPQVNWVSMCAHNGPGQKDLVLNGDAISIDPAIPSTGAPPRKLMINDAGNQPWGLAMLFTFTDHLSTEEMQAMSKYMLEYRAPPAAAACPPAPPPAPTKFTISWDWDPDNKPTNITVQPTD